MSRAMLMGTAYAVLTVGLSTATVAGSSTSSTVTSGSVTATKSGGSGQVATTWSYVSGHASIVPATPNSSATSFQATGMGAGESRSAIWRATIRDLITGETLPTGNVTINLRCDYPALSIGGLGNVDAVLVSSGVVTVSGGTSISASGGVPPYSYSWSSSGDFTMSGSGASRSFSRALPPQGGVLGSASGTVTDAIGQSATASCQVMLRNLGTAPAPLTAYANPASVQGYSLSNTVNTGSTSIVVSGGVGPYSYSWSRIGGVGSGAGSFSYSTAEDGEFYGTFQCVVTDALGNQTACTVSATYVFGNLN